jgi:predicted ATP-grasp superfamily ATP-dependent carboligase
MIGPDVIVLDANERSSLALTRSIGRTGVSVVVADHLTHTLAGASRYARASLQYPSPAQEPGAFRVWLRALAAAHPGAVLLPMTDHTLPLCLEERDALSGLKLPFPTLHAYQAVSDKYELFRRCEQLVIDVPATTLVRPGDALKPEDWLHQLPIVVKPRWSAARVDGRLLRQSVTYAQSADQVVALVQRALEEGAQGVLLQEHIAGEGRGIFGLYDHGRRIATFAHRRLREKPPSGGVSVYSESMPVDPHLTSAMDRLLGPLDWHGVAMAEFKVTARGRAVLIEINGRFWGSLQLAVDAGVDFPKLLYDLASGGSPACPTHYQVGRRLRWLLGDFDHGYLLFKDRSGSVSASQRARAALRSLTPWLPRTKMETFRLTDPMPFLAELRQYFRAPR